MAKLFIILGAGASKEVRLPIGEELKVVISRALGFRFEDFGRLKAGDSLVYEALRIHARATNVKVGDTLVPAARRIAAALPLAISIDNFLDAHRGNKDMEVCGKLAIVREILLAEQRSSLYLDPRVPSEKLNYAALASTWFNSFWQVLSENCTEQEIGQRLESIAVVSFNYDRCFAHYLYNALRDYYELSDTRAAELARKVEIFYPYGRVGALPWEMKSEAVPFGSELQASQLLALSSQIKTFTEGTDPGSTDVTTLWARAAEASQIVFLGFAFHPQNIGLLWPKSRGDHPVQQCVGSAYGISAGDLNVINGDLQNRLAVPGIHVKLPNLTCCEVFREYRRTLSKALAQCVTS